MPPPAGHRSRPAVCGLRFAISGRRFSSAVRIAILVLAALPLQSVLAGQITSPLGVWKTFDDKTGEARALVRIYEQDGKLFGRLEHSFKPGAESRTCEVCADERKNRPIIGLVIVRNMKSDGDDFTGGDILDPESGSVYRCKMHLSEDGSRLVVRGYIGFSLLGRSQTWQRQN